MKKKSQFSIGKHLSPHFIRYYFIFQNTHTLAAKMSSCSKLSVLQSHDLLSLSFDGMALIGFFAENWCYIPIINWSLLEKNAPLQKHFWQMPINLYSLENSWINCRTVFSDCKLQFSWDLYFFSWSILSYIWTNSWLQ